MYAYNFRGRGAVEGTVVVDILSDSAPSTMPTDGTDVTNMEATDVIAPSSTLMVLSTNTTYMLGENAWYPI